MKKINLFLTAALFAFAVSAQTTSTFENLHLAADTFWNGSDLSGGFSSGHAFFPNAYDTSYHSWSGFAYSDVKNDTTAGFSNQYSAITDAGYNGSNNYAVADEYGRTFIKVKGLAHSGVPDGFYITNATYAYLSMKNGDAFAKKFGGPTGNDPDWFRLTVKGWLNGVQATDTVDFYLADYRFTNNALDYIVNTWQWVDLRSLGKVDSITFHVASTDTAGGFGMNTPAYFCIDNFSIGPVVQNSNVTITYAQDTLINVLVNDVTDSSGIPLTVTLLSAPQIPGASAIVDSAKNIWYIPGTGIVAPDTLLYSVCDTLGQCDTAWIFFNVTGLTGITEAAAIQTNIFPNPFSNAFTIYHLSGLNEINVYDLQGRLVINQVCNKGELYTLIDASSLSAGSYLVKTISDKGVSVGKVIKQ